MGQTSRVVFPFAGRGDKEIARLADAAPTPNGSSSSSFLGASPGLTFAGALVGLAEAATGAGLSFEAVGFATAFGGGALPGFPPFIEAPQNGQYSASSSSTDCWHAGQVGSMSGSFRMK